MEQRIRRALLAALCTAWLVAAPLWPAPAHADEAAVRAATQSLVEAWNRHDAKAWSAHLTEDAWVTDVDDSLYTRYKGREAAIGRFSDSLRGSDLQWQIVRMKMRPDGIMSVVVVEELSVLPKTDGKYKAVYTSNPSLARWRREADGRWRLVFFTSHSGWARAEIKKDDEGVVVAAAPAPTPSPPSAAAAPRPAAQGGEPAEYTAFRGRLAHGCNYCHGRPPTLPTSETTSRIVPVGAAAADGAALRAAMQRKDLGGAMDWVLADPGLDDATLDVLRLYLVDVRDGALPAQLAFDGPGSTRELALRNERSSRDVPARIALLRVSGPFTLDTPRSTCRSGGTLAGQSACKLVLRAAPAAAPGATGTLEMRLAPTSGLEPRVRRTALHVGG